MPPTEETSETLNTWNMLQQTYLLAFRHLEGLTAQVGLSYSQAAALGVLSAADRALPLSHLARYLTQEAQSTTELADRLERRGLVRRTRDARDRRLVLLELTDAGRELFATLQPAIIQGCNQLFADHSERERATFARLLGPVRERAAGLLGIEQKRLRLIGEAS